MGKSWREIIRNADSENFVGRLEEIASFRNELSSSPKKLIFFISGQGGIGKTTLLNQFQDIAQELEWNVASSDEQQSDTPKVLGKLADDLKRQGVQLKKFSERWEKYKESLQLIESDPEAPEGLAGLIGRGIARTGFILLDGVPIVRKGIEIIGQEAIESQASQWASYLAKKITNKDEVALLQDPVNILSKLFFEEISSAADEKNILLCFDNYEFTRDFLDNWMIELPEYELSQNVRMAIAGRTPPGSTLESLKSVMLHIPLGVFSEEEAEDFLDKNKIADPQRRKEIVETTGRLPVLMSWLASPESKEPDSTLPVSDIVERFLRWVKNPSYRQTALYCAVPRFLNIDIVSQILSSESSKSFDEEFSWLINQPFVREREYGWEYHDVVRRQIIRYLHQSSKETYRKLHEKLASYYGEKIKIIASGDKENWENESWRKYTIEYIFHRLHMNPEQNWGEFMALVIHAIVEKKKYAREMVLAVSLWGTKEDFSHTQRTNLALLAEKIKLIENRDWSNLINLFNVFCDDHTISPKAQAFALGLRARAYSDFKKYYEAIEDLTTAVGMYESAWLFKERGMNYEEVEMFDNARSDFEKSLQLDPKLASSYLLRGRALARLGELDRAMEDFEKCIELDSDFEHAIQKEKGFTFQRFGKYSEAVESFHRALMSSPTCRESWNGLIQSYAGSHPLQDIPSLVKQIVVAKLETVQVLVSRGVALTENGFYKAALDDLNLAIERDPKNPIVTANRGRIYVFLEEYDKAISDFVFAIGEKPNLGWPFLELGRIYRKKSDVANALKNFESAKQAKSILTHEAETEIGKTLFIAGKYNEAADAIYRALKVSPSCSECWRFLAHAYSQLYPIGDVPNLLRQLSIPESDNAMVIACRAFAMSEIGLFDTALDEYNVALKKAPQFTWAIGGRARTLVELGEIDQALIDLNQAIELTRTNPWFHQLRARVFNEKNEYELALRDLDRAIKLSPELESEVTNEKGLLLSYLGRYSEAWDSYQKALTNDPIESYTVHYNLAVLMSRWKGIEKAKKDIKKSRSILTQISRDLPQLQSAAFYGLGGLASVEGDRESALLYLQKAMGREQNNAVISWATRDIAWQDLRSDPAFLSIISNS